MFSINGRLTKDLFRTYKSILGCTGIYDKFEDLCIGRLRPNGRRSQPVFPIRLCNWVDDVSYFDNLILINTSIQQWDHMFRVNSIQFLNFYWIIYFRHHYQIVHIEVSMK
jgi:hypothetical protein